MRNQALAFEAKATEPLALGINPQVKYLIHPVSMKEDAQTQKYKSFIPRTTVLGMKFLAVSGYLE